MTAEQKKLLRIAASRMLEAIRYYKEFAPRPGIHGDASYFLLYSAARVITHVMPNNAPSWTTNIQNYWNQPDEIAAKRKQLLKIINKS